MIKKTIFIVALIFSCTHGQNIFIVSVNPGEYLYNSENDMHITDDRKVRWFPGLSLSFEKENVLGYNIQMEYSFVYFESMRNIKFYKKESETEPNTLLYANYFLTGHNYDLSIVSKLSESFNFYVGPSLAVYNRTIDYGYPYNDPEIAALNLHDRLVSVCVGINAAINMKYPFSKAPRHFFFYSGLKVRYLHSILFDNRGRNTANYYQSFLTAQLNIGLGYNF